MNLLLILKVVQKDVYKLIFEKIVCDYCNESIDFIIDCLLIVFGIEILKLILGCVLIEVDVCLLFDMQCLIDKGCEFIKLYEVVGVGCECILIKFVLMWEGICVVEVLQKEGIKCNMILFFLFVQVVVCVEVGVQLILLFVGCIYDWYKKQVGVDWNEVWDGGVNDLGV